MSEFNEFKPEPDDEEEALPEEPEALQYYPLPEYEESLSYGGLVKRNAAFVLDMMLFYIIERLFLFKTILAAVLILLPNAATNPRLMSGGVIMMELLLWVTAQAVCWFFWSSSPGKMLLGMRVVDSATGARISRSKTIRRALGYLLSFVTLGLGFLVVGLDSRKRGLHDRIAGTVVVNDYGGYKRLFYFVKRKITEWLSSVGRTS